MRKLILDVTALQVQSFEAVDEKSNDQGTVKGHAITQLTCPRTMCGRECLSGWRPCQPTDAWTNGEVMCDCGGESGQYAC